MKASYDTSSAEFLNLKNSDIVINMKLYIFQIDNSNLYYISTPSHITTLTSMLNKYCPEKIKQHSYYNIVDYKNATCNKDVVFLNNDESFMDYFNHFFKKYNYNSDNWYSFEPEIFSDVITYIKSIETEKIQKVIKPINDNSTYKCNKCNNNFTTLTYLEKHQEKCNGLICNTCNITLSNKCNYNNHIKICGIFTCNKCNETFNSKTKYSNHYKKCNKEIVGNIYI